LLLLGFEAAKLIDTNSELPVTAIGVNRGPGSCF
jgi:hypothetical protein